jgi:hypothetical protein
MSSDNIRLPDKIVQEQLIQDNRSEYDKQVEEALNQSLSEYNEQKELNEKYEEELHQKSLIEMSNRKNKFKDLLIDLKKLINYDTEIKNIYEIIEPIIETYSMLYFETIEFDSETYDKIFSELGKIRTDKKNIENLKTVIIKV